MHMFSVHREAHAIASCRTAPPSARSGIAPLRLIDQYYDDGDPEWSTVQHESELAPYKAATDVVVIGKAYAPRGVADGADGGRRAGGHQQEGAGASPATGGALSRRRGAGVHRSRAVHRDGDSLRPGVRRARREERAGHSVHLSAQLHGRGRRAAQREGGGRRAGAAQHRGPAGPADARAPLHRGTGSMAPAAAAAGVRLAAAHLVSALRAARARIRRSSIRAP